MAVSLRRRYPGRLEGRNDDGPVSVPPSTGAELPPKAAAPAEPLKVEPEESPVEQAARDAVKARIAELTEAEPVQPVVIEQQPSPTEQIIANTGLPPRVQAWLRSHPDYITDAAKNQRMQEMHYVAKHHTGEEFTDAYLAKMEELLGMRRAALSIPVLGETNAAPARQQRSGPPVSAPISRDAPSMSTGRPASAPTQLTAEEFALVRSLGITPETYREKKRLMNELKANGTIQDGR